MIKRLGVIPDLSAGFNKHNGMIRQLDTISAISAWFNEQKIPVLFRENTNERSITLAILEKDRVFVQAAMAYQTSCALGIDYIIVEDAAQLTQKLLGPISIEEEIKLKENGMNIEQHINIVLGLLYLGSVFIYIRTENYVSMLLMLLMSLVVVYRMF